MEHGGVREFVPLADDEKLFRGEIPADLPGLALTYTPQEYTEHVRRILELLETPSYRFCALPDTPFPNTRIIFTEEAVKVTRIREPRITFMISHPALREAFRAYAARLQEQYRMDPLALRHLLEAYV